MKSMATWKEELVEEMNLLGHRNWIVVTDMAYPLQSQPGIKTIYTGAEYEEVLATVNNVINASPHVRAIIYQDSELNLLNDEDIDGISELREKNRKILGEDIIFLDHEELIGKLDAISKIFNVIIIKSSLTIPYTTTFFELDCKYWDESKQKILEARK